MSAAPKKNSKRMPILPGLEAGGREAKDLRGMRVGVLTNPSGIARNLAYGIDLMEEKFGVKIARLFAPEHGLRGGVAAAARFGDAMDAATGLPIVSLHGAARRPLPEHLAGLDAVVYDIQDVGHRTYTFISSLARMIEACAEAGVALWVLDRPNPLGGDTIGGPMLDADLESFIGVHNVPQQYGLTPGEFALLYQRQRAPKAEVRVVLLRGWRRAMRFGHLAALGWPWVPPSEHIPRWETCFFYAMTGTFGELGSISNGIGTPQPFELIGAPWIDGGALADALGRAFKKAGEDAVACRPTQFTPRYGAHAGAMCGGVQLHVLDFARCRAALVCTEILKTLAELYSARGIFAPPSARENKSDAAPPERYDLFLKALGDRAFADALARGGPYGAVQRKIVRAHAAYLKRREKFLLYE